MQDSLQAGGGEGRRRGRGRQGGAEGLPQPSQMMIAVGYAASQHCNCLKERRPCVERLHCSQTARSSVLGLSSNFLLLSPCVHMWRLSGCWKLLEAVGSCWQLLEAAGDTTGRDSELLVHVSVSTALLCDFTMFSCLWFRGHLLTIVTAAVYLRRLFPVF